jgi:hypothetical protein
MGQHESSIQNRMQKLGGITASFLARLTDVPETRLSQAFRGIRDLDNQHIFEIAKALNELEELQTACAPVPVSFVSPKVIRAVLEERRTGNLWIDVRENQSDWMKKDTQDNGNTESNS